MKRFFKNTGKFVWRILKKITTSSRSPQEWSMAFKGVLYSLVPITILVTGATPEEVTTIFDGLVTGAYYGFAFLSNFFIVVGGIRKFYYKRWSASE
jgi:sulfite exporter TauE/SafE